MNRRFELLPIGLAARFTLFVALLLLALTAAFVALGNRAIENSAEQSFQERANQMLTLIGAVSGNLPPDRRLYDLQQVLNGVTALGDKTRYAFVMPLDDTGAPMSAGSEALADNPLASQALRDALSGGTPAWRRSGDILHMAIPVVVAAKPIAAVRIGLSTEDVERAISASVGRNIFLALGFITLALPLTALVMNFVTAPIRRLTQATRRVAAGDFGVHLFEDRNDELGQLAHAFANMTRGLSDSVDAVHRLTFTDGVSGLANREQMRRSIQALVDEGKEATFVLVEVDRLKSVNEALGMDAGDDAVVEIARRFRDADAKARLSLRHSEANDILIARLGSDDFGILVCGAGNPAAAALIAEIFRNSFDCPFLVAGHEVSIGARAGTALLPAHGRNLSSLMQSASGEFDQARIGKTGLNAGETRRDSHAYRRLVVEQEIRHALDHDELEVFYQPQVALTDGAIIGAEALVRWRHPVRGLVGPIDFIEIAEEVGLLDAIGTFVLCEASRQSAEWARKGMEPRVAVNVSPSQCQRSDFAASVLRIIEDSGMQPHLLDIEITETTAMRDPRKTARELIPLRGAGVRVAIDDFGTGYSNLASLTRMPIDVLKIDRSFVSECVRDGSARVVVATILTMARNLGFETIAEGVESAAQRDYLISQGCMFAQGYLFGRPVPADEFEAVYAARRRLNAREPMRKIQALAIGGNGRPAA